MVTNTAILDSRDQSEQQQQEDLAKKRQKLLIDYRQLQRQFGKGSTLHAYNFMDAAAEGKTPPLTEFLSAFGSWHELHQLATGRVNYRWNGDWSQAARSMKGYAAYLGHSPTHSERRAGYERGIIPSDNVIRNLSGRGEMSAIYRLCGLDFPKD